MATINGYTAQRMKAIEDSTIVDGTVVGDDLILKTRDDTNINAGNVRGPQGSPGISDVNAAVTAYLNSNLNVLDPPGIPKPYTGAAAPSGYAFCDAATEHDGSTYPVLAALYGTGSGCVNGSSASGKFRLPNLKGKALVGKDASIVAFDTLHKTGGSKDAIIVTHNHNHDHTAATSNGGADHTHNIENGGADHTHSVSSDGSHDHTSVDGDAFVISIGGPQNNRIPNDESTTDGAYVTFTSADDAGSHNHGGATGFTSSYLHDHGTSSSSSTYAHTHPVSVSPDATAAVGGSSGTDGNLPPYRVINWIMRLA